MTQTTIDLTAREVAEGLGVSIPTFNNWKRAAQLKTGKTYGRKQGKASYFSAEEVEGILKLGKSNEEGYPNPPRQVYESEDVEACQDNGFMVLAQSSSALIQDLQSVLALAQQQEQAIVETAARYLHPSNRRARILNGLAQRLQGSSGESITATLEIAFNQPPVLPQPRAIQAEFI